MRRRQSDESPRDTGRISRRTVLRTTAAVGGLGTVGATSGATQRSDGEVVWEFEAGNSLWSSPTVVDGLAYVGSDDWSVYAVDAASGDEQWSFQTENSVQSSPTVVDGTVFVGSEDASLYALDAASGDEQWRFETDNDIIGSPTVDREAVYVGSTDNTLYALDRDSGDERWRYETGNSISASPTVAETPTEGSEPAETVFVGSDLLHAIDAESGEDRWTAEVPDAAPSPTVANPTDDGDWMDVSDGGTVFAGSGDSRLYALDAETGAERWRFDADRSINASPTVAGSTVFVGSTSGVFHAVDAETGDEEWSVDTGKRIDSSATVAGSSDGSEDTVFVGVGNRFDGEGIVFAFGADSGDERWRFTETNRVYSSPVVVDGTLFVGSQDATLYALDAGVEGSSHDSRALWGTLGHHDDLRQLREEPQETQTSQPTESTETQSAVPTETTTEEPDEGGGLPFELIAAAVGLLGGSGALWYLLFGRDDDEEAEEAAPHDDA